MSGFSCYDLNDVYQGFELTELRIAPDDNHPNKQGHKLIAEKFYLIVKEILNEVE
jgi:lysophospholipase L1-like esterase